MRIEYLAGLLEGEGWFGIAGQSSPTIELQMTDRDVVERVYNSWPTTQKFTIRDKGPNKTTYVWRISGMPALEIMTAVYPLMGQRRRARITELIDRYAANVLSTKVVCGKGHWKIGDNVIIENKNNPKRNPNRKCRECEREARKARYIRKR